MKNTKKFEKRRELNDDDDGKKKQEMLSWFSHIK